MANSFCLFCNETFTRNSSLKDHLKLKRCKVDLLELHKIHKELSEKNKELNEQLSSITINGNSNLTATNGSIIANTVNINVSVNSIENIDVSYIKDSVMKKLTSEYKTGEPSVNLLISDYIKQMLCNKEHPENHSVKYIQKKPPLFNTKMLDSDGKIINVVKNLSETLELIHDPILNILISKLKDYIKNYKEDPEYDRDKVNYIYKEMKQETVYEALRTVLKNDILQDIEMKFKKTLQNS